MDHQAGLFIQDQQCVIFIENFKGNRLGLHHERLGPGDPEHDDVTGFDFVTGLGDLPVDGDVAVEDQSLESRSREIGVAVGLENGPGVWGFRLAKRQSRSAFQRAAWTHTGRVGYACPCFWSRSATFCSKSRFFQTYPGLFDFRREPAAFKTFFGLAHGGLGSFNVDIFRLLGDLCKDGDFVGRHVGESPQHRHVMLGFSNTIVQFADPKGRQKMTMARQHPKVAFRSGRGDLVHVFTHQELIRCHHFQQEFFPKERFYLNRPLSFVSQFLRLLDRFFYRPDHVKRLLRQIVMLAVDDFLEAPDGVLEFHVFPRRAREGFGHVERLRQEALQFSRARDGSVCLLRTTRPYPE